MGQDPTRPYNERFLKLRQSYFKLVHLSKVAQAGCLRSRGKRASAPATGAAKRCKTGV